MMNQIGKSTHRVDALAKVKGQALFPCDINMPDQAYLKILFSGRAHAIVKRIDTAQAEAVEGVLSVLTAKDVPVNEFGYYVNDQPVLCGPGSANYMPTGSAFQATKWPPSLLNLKKLPKRHAI
jgi:CO/xanthine dehydrogenase Mo-binding subunit